MRLLLWLPLLLCACRALEADPVSLQRHEFEHVAMGTSWSIVLFADHAAQAEGAAAAAFAAVDEVDRVASDYDRSSELSRLTARADELPVGTRLEVSPLLYELLSEAHALASETQGAFDPTLGTLTRIWRRARRQAEPPSAERLARARASCGWEGLQLDPSRRTVSFARRGMRLDLGGVAKGQALDRALAALEGAGVTRCLIEGGGDLRAGAAPPDAAHWVVALEGTDLGIALVDAGLATSGDSYRGFEHEGVRYSHLLNPRTGTALEGGISATVLAPTAAAADAYASAACVVGPTGAAEWFERGTGRAARIVAGESPGERPWISPTWHEHRFAGAPAQQP